LPLCANGEAQAPFAIHTELARAVTPPFNEARTGGPAQGDMMRRIKVISPYAHTISRLERARLVTVAPCGVPPVCFRLLCDDMIQCGLVFSTQGLCKPSG
jgi:hypothetical protein